MDQASHHFRLYIDRRSRRGADAEEALVSACEKRLTSPFEIEVIDVVATPGHTDDEVVAVAAALEAHSEHPLAAAILARATTVPEADDVQAVVGHGLTGVVAGRPARLGKPGFVDPAGLADRVADLQADGATVVLVEHDGTTVGLIAVRDELRPEARRAIAELRDLGMGRVAMLTGDNQRTADTLAAQAGVDDVFAELRPEDKVRRIEGLQVSGSTAMVGDGINDAPALATADVGIAMGAMGSDVAIEAADVALMGDDLTQLPALLRHARRAGRIMRQNLALSGLILLTLVPLAGFGVLGLAAAVATHELAEVLVIANGVRAGRQTRRPTETPTSRSAAPEPTTATP